MILLRPHGGAPGGRARGMPDFLMEEWRCHSRSRTVEDDLRVVVLVRSR